MKRYNHSKPDLSHEKALWKSGYRHIGGVDEAGRGAWAGPVFAAIVILADIDQNNMFIGHVRDSKQMTPIQRNKWCSLIKEFCLDWGVDCATHGEIDSMGIVTATRLAILRALQKLSVKPDALLLDYLELPGVSILQKALVHGDQQVLSIAAASVLAKTERDMFMKKMDITYPGYSFRSNKGYGTVAHQQALVKIGVCRIHRKSFRPIKAHLNLHDQGIG